MSEPRDLQPLLNPRSIAVVGASPTSRAGMSMVRNLQTLGYGGAIYPVNPRYEEVLGLRCYPSVAAIPEPVDAMLVAVATKYVVPTLEDGAQKGVRGAVVCTTGFGEAGEEGRARDRDLRRIAQQSGMLICGPNCMGLVSLANRQSMWMGDLPGYARPGRIAAVCQSGSVAISLLNSGRLALSHLISSGNEAVVHISEYLAYLVEDPHTDVLLAFVESVRSPDLFLRVADRARELAKPLIVLKVGASEKATAASFAHTGALAGSTAVYEALCQQKGLIKVDDLNEMMETAELFATLRGRWPRGNRAGAITSSGGFVSLLADTGERAGVVFPDLAAPARAKLAEVLPTTPTVTNPLDAWGNGDYGRNFPPCVEAIVHDENVDLLAVCQNGPTDDPRVVERRLEVARAAAAVARGTDKPVVYFDPISMGLHPEIRQTLAEANVPLLQGIRESLRAISSFMRYAAFLRRSEPSAGNGMAGNGPAHLELGSTLVGEGPLSESRSLALLERVGIPAARHLLVGSPAEAVAAAERLGYPVAVKVCSPHLPHKSEAGAVRLNVGDAEGVRQAYAEVLANARQAVPDLAVEGVLVAEMANGIELIAGLTRDATFGHVVLLGLGGIFAEVLRDVSMRLVPLSRVDAEEMLAELRGRALLEGFRGQQPVDRDAVVEVLLSLSRLAEQHADRIEQVDVNPLVASSHGVLAADALVVLRSTASQPDSPNGQRVAQDRAPAHAGTPAGPGVGLRGTSDQTVHPIEALDTGRVQAC